MTLCYPQLGAESDWRTANTASFKETAEKLGVKLIFSDAQQKQENQISAIRACIQQGVNVIALPPVVETGWDAVLTEAKNAEDPGHRRGPLRHGRSVPVCFSHRL